jgi:predicted nuclease of restriction endonuclease-like (RecB) superfamily
MNKIQIAFITSIKEKIHIAQYEALKAVNTHLINLYWDIGRDISGKQAESWGKSIVPVLSNELQKEFPGISGFSERNLWLMAQFYTEYYDDEFLHPLVAEISWTKHIAIMNKCKDNQEVRAFLLEMGNQFTFVGNQFKIKAGKKEYFIDLLLYHRALHCLVAVELKIGEFQPEYKGKMEFYLAILNEKIKLPEENDSIGIIICKEKDRTIVEYSLRTSPMPIGVATYTTSPKLPKDYKKLLPDSKAIGEKISEFFNAHEVESRN